MKVSKLAWWLKRRENEQTAKEMERGHARPGGGAPRVLKKKTCFACFEWVAATAFLGHLKHELWKKKKTHIIREST